MKWRHEKLHNTHFFKNGGRKEIKSEHIFQKTNKVNTSIDINNFYFQNSTTAKTKKPIRKKKLNVFLKIKVKFPYNYEFKRYSLESQNIKRLNVTSHMYTRGNFYHGHNPSLYSHFRLFLTALLIYT